MLTAVPPATLHILLALAEGERHGYAIIQEVEARTEGELRLSPGTLYRSIQRMLEQGLIVESLRRPARALVVERARGEMRRLAQLIRLGRERGLEPEPA